MGRPAAWPLFVSLPLSCSRTRGRTMADVEESTSEVAAPAEAGTMDILTALKEVLRKALVHNGLARGLRECVKTLDRRQAHLCVLSSACNEPAYTRLIEALCAEHNINLIKVPDAKQLGEWVGLCQYDKEAKPRKVVGCSCVVVKDFGEESEALNVVLQYFKERTA